MMAASGQLLFPDRIFSLVLDFLCLEKPYVGRLFTVETKWDNLVSSCTSLATFESFCIPRDVVANTRNSGAIAAFCA